MPHTVQLTNWLELAYGVEREVIDTLEQQLPHLTGHDEMEAKIQEHLERSQRHAALVEECLTRLGGEASALGKGGLGSLLHSLMGRGVQLGGVAGGLGMALHGIMSERSTLPQGLLVKYGIADFTAEHYEIATYTVVLTAARGCRDEETARVCQEILREEQEMADWLAQRLPDNAHVMVRAGLDRQKAPDSEVQEEGHPFDLAGTFEGGWLYAVFDDEQQAAQAEQALSKINIQSQRLQGPEAVAHLRGEFGGILAKMGRIIKSFGHQEQYATHYATHVERGRIVLAVQCPEQATADEVTQTIKDHGAFDIRYFGTTGTQRMPE